MSEAVEVPIEFKGRHDHITERMKAHAARKIGRLSRYHDRLTRIEVVADHAHKNPEIEMIVHLRRGAPMVSKDRGTSFSGTIDLLVDKVETLLRKMKEKRADHKSAGRGKARDDGADEGDGRGPDDETYEEVVRKTLRK